MAAGAQHEERGDPVDSAAVDKDAAMQQLLAEALAEFEFDNVEDDLRGSGGAVRCAETKPCTKALYREHMERVHAAEHVSSAGIRCGGAQGPRCPRSDAGRVAIMPPRQCM